MPSFSKFGFVERALDELIRRTPVGDRLVPEQDLARDLGCARSTVRQALAPYIRQGVIHRRRGGGTILVRHPTSKPNDVVLELWTPAFEHKGPTRWAWWDSVVDRGPDVRVVQQSQQIADALDPRGLSCGAMRVGAAPSLEILDSPCLVEQSAAHAVADLSELAKVLPNRDDIEDWAWSLISVGGHLLGVPFLAHGFGLWIERSALRQAGLSDHAPSNWQELTDALLALSRATGKALPATPSSNATDLLGTLVALAGGGLHHDEQNVPSRRSEKALRSALGWYSSLVRQHKLIDPTVTFGKSATRRLRERTFGFFHGTTPIYKGDDPELSLCDYWFWPIPPARRAVGHRYPVMVHAFVLNRRLTHEQRLAALRYVDLATSSASLQRLCETEDKLFLVRKSQWRWAQSPRWISNLATGWDWIQRQPLCRLSTPAGLTPRVTTDLYVRTVLGEEVV